MKVKVKKLSRNAVLPFKTYDKDFCYDVVATSCEEIARNVYRYQIGLAFQIDRNDKTKLYDEITPFGTTSAYIIFKNAKCNISIDFRPRSSVWETGMVLSNCEGTVDEIFTGGVSAVFYHVFTDMPKYEVGDKIGQIKLGFTLPMEFEVVEELDETERGANGYGSTGK